MSDDLVERLRRMAKGQREGAHFEGAPVPDGFVFTADEAADRIEQLEARCHALHGDKTHLRLKLASVEAQLAARDAGERAKVVAWLRSTDAPDLDWETPFAARQCAYVLECADAIERGDHLANAAQAGEA